MPSPEAIIEAIIFGAPAIAAIVIAIIWGIMALN